MTRVMGFVWRWMTFQVRNESETRLSAKVKDLTQNGGIVLERLEQMKREHEKTERVLGEMVTEARTAQAAAVRQLESERHEWERERQQMRLQVEAAAIEVKLLNEIISRDRMRVQAETALSVSTIAASRMPAIPQG